MQKYIILCTSIWLQLSSVFNTCILLSKNASETRHQLLLPTCYASPVLRSPLPWRGSHNGQHIAVGKKWSKSPIFKFLRESRGPSWYYGAWKFTVVFISSTAITRVIYCYQQGNLWIPTNTAGGKWTSPGTNVFCVLRLYWHNDLCVFCLPLIFIRTELASRHYYC